MKFPRAMMMGAAALTAGAVAGFGLGKARRPGAPPAVASAPASRAVPPPMAADAATPGAAADAGDGLQPFPPGFEGLSFEEICRKGPSLARYTALLAWAERVPREEATAEIFKLMSGNMGISSMENDLTLHFLTGIWAEKEPDLAVAGLRKDAHARRIAFWGWPTLLGTVAQKNPTLARQIFEDNSDIFSNTGFDRVLTDFGIALGKTDPKGALAWADGLPFAQRALAIAALAQSGAFNFPEMAAQLVPYLDAPAEARYALADRWTAAAPEAALDWAQTQSAECKKTFVHACIMHSPETALRWLEQHGDAEEQKTYWPDLASTFGSSDPVTGAAWVTGLPTGEDREKAIGHFVGGWTEPAALDWVRALPEEADRVAGLIAYAGRRRDNDDPAQAAEILASVPASSERRLPELENTMSRWAEQDAQAATAWVEQQPSLPDADRERLWAKITEATKAKQP